MKEVIGKLIYGGFFLGALMAMIIANDKQNYVVLVSAAILYLIGRDVLSLTRKQ